MHVFLVMFILTPPPPLSTFPVGGNQSNPRKPTTFGRASTDSFHMSLQRESNPRSEA